MIAGTFLALENGFQRLRSSQKPDTESPNDRGELSSIYSVLDGSYDRSFAMLTEPTSDAITTLAPIDIMVET